MFRHEIISPLWENIQIQGFGFDLEVLFLARKMNYKIKEVPVNWEHVRIIARSICFQRFHGQHAGQYFSNQKPLKNSPNPSL